MDYKELIERAKQGRSVNSTAQALGVPLSTFQRYEKGERFPDFDIGLRIVQAAGVDLATAFVIIALAQRDSKRQT